jgi:hypothetical protein
MEASRPSIGPFVRGYEVIAQDGSTEVSGGEG